MVNPLEKIDQCVEQYCHDAEYHNGHDHGGKLEDLAGIDDQISQASLAADHFPDHDTNERKADIDLHNT